MDSYTKDLHMQDKDYVSDIPNNELSPLEGDHEESQPRFSVEEPLEVQLRFELGSLVDAQVLLDTHGPRESHWDFVRQEQGRFQTSSEDNTGLLVHVKQDDLKPFDNCEGWPRSTSQVDAQLFIDAQDDVSMITEAFGGKDRSMSDLVQDDRNLLLPSYRHQEDATAWIGEEGKAHEVDNSCRECIVDGATEASQISVERPDTRGACESSTEFSPIHSENIQIQTIENNEKHEAEQSAPDLVIEPLLNSEQKAADNAASLTVSEPQCQVPCNVPEEANVYQDLPLDCSKQNQADSIQPEASSIDEVEVSAQTAAIIPTEDVNIPAGVTLNAQDSCVMEEESKTIAVETKVDDETLLVISESIKKDVEAGHVLSNKTEETQETGTAPVIQSHDIVSHSSPKLESETPGVIPVTVEKQHTSGGTCFDSERLMQSSEVIAVPESGEKQSASEPPYSKVDCILQGSEVVTTSSNSEVEKLKETSPMNNMKVSSDEMVDGMDGARLCGDLEKIDEAKDEAGEGLDAQEQNTHTLETVDGMDVAGLLEKNDEAKCEAGDGLDAQEQNPHIPAIQLADTNLAGEKAVGAMKLSTAEQQVTCLEPAASIPKQDAADVSTSAGNLENTSMCNKMEHIQGIDTMADLSEVTPDIALKEINLGEQQASNLSRAPQVSAVHGDADSLQPADYSVESKDHTADDNVNMGQDGEHKSVIPTMLTVEDLSLGDESMNKIIEAQSIDESSRQDELQADSSEALIQELSMKHHNNDQSASDYSISSANPILLNEDKNSTESTHPGGVLHVLLDVHKEGATCDSLLKEASVQDHAKMVESKEFANVQKLNPGDAIRKDSASAEDVAAGLSDTYASGLTGVAAITGSQEDEQLASNYASPQQDKVSKRKSDPPTRNNRLKDSARASPLQGRSDQKQKDAGKEGLGRRKSTPKNAAQKKGTEPVEIILSPQKSVSKSASGRKKGVPPPIVQDVMVSPVAKDGFQTPANISKTVLAVNARQQPLPDVNGSEIAVPMVLPVQPFSEPQQVQLRAQILVYGSLIQGAAPEEALMVAAFSNVIGAPVREAGRDLEASGRALWEKQWQAAVERIQIKSSRDTLRDSSRASGVLVSNLPVTSAKASEAGLKVNSSPGVASNTVDARNVTAQHTRVSDVPATKGHPSHPKHSADSGLIISASRSNQSVAVVVPPGPSTSTAFRSVSSSLSENLSQSSKARVDLQQATPQTYYPAPPLGSFLAAAPQWLSTATFPGPWVPQTPAAVYNTPSPLFSHPQAIVSSDHAPDMAVARRNTPSSGTVVPINPIVPALYTPVVGSMSVTPTAAAADLVQKRQSVSESRPRKRKKTQSEIYVLPTDVVPNAPFMVGTGNQVTSVSDLPAGQGGLMMSSPVHLPSLSAPVSLAMVVANSQTPKAIRETSIVAVNANKASAPDSTNMLNAGGTPTRAIEQQLGKSVSLQNSASHLVQAEASAEEAASVAASAVRESESFWSQLKAQKNAGLTSDIEMQLVSSAVAMATAASVAKAAAAAARAAYEAAVQAKMISEDALGSSKQGNESESFRLLQDKAVNASQVWGMPESYNSIMAAAKLASKKRLEAASAARARAQNFESVLRAAELATNAVSQVGSVIAMGESVPFTLEMLMEAGPQGLQRLLSLGSLEDKDKTKSKGTDLQSPGKKGTPKQKGSIEKDKRPPKKSIGANKEASIQREARVDGWTTDSAIPARSEFDARINTELGIGLMTEFTKQNINDHLALSMQASRQGLPPIRLESGLAMQQEVSIIDNQITKGSLVEVMSNEKGLRGVWFSARVQNVDGGKVFVLYDDLLSDDGFSPLEEWIQLKGSASKAPRVRLAHPNTNISFEGTRKRRREAMGNHKWSVGDRVDAWMRDGWWEGEIKEIIEDGESKAKVFFPGDGDTSLVKTSKLRPSLVWSNGHWVLWTDAKQGNNQESKGRGDLHEGETPTAKRQKTEKAELSNTSKQKLVGTSIAEVAATQKEGSLYDSAAVKLPTDFKGFTVDGTDKSKQQGSKVVFGVPRPTKKRKLIEVSKHYNSARGARSTSTLNVKATNNKHEEVTIAALGFATGSSEINRLDSSKAKKRVLPSQKSRPHKDTIPETAHSKGNAIRSKKDRPFADNKTLARKNPSTREGLLPSTTKNTEGKVINKKKLPLEKSQPESEEQPEGFPIIDVPSQKVASPSSGTISEVNKNSSSILLEESGKEPSHTAQKIGKPSEKQTVKESGKDSSHVTQARDSKQTSVKEREIPPSQQAKDTNKQPLNPANGNKHSSKKKETQPSDPLKDNKEPTHLSKESQKQSLVQVKESESQPGQEGETVSSREKQPTIPTNDSEKQPKETDKGKDVGKSGVETWEPRRTSRKIQPTSKLLEGLQTAPKLGKNSSSHDKGSRVASKAVPHQ